MIREPGTNVDGLPFDEETIGLVWRKGTLVPGDPMARTDICGYVIRWNLYGKSAGVAG